MTCPNCTRVEAWGRGEVRLFPCIDCRRKPVSEWPPAPPFQERRHYTLDEISEREKDIQQWLDDVEAREKWRLRATVKGSAAMVAALLAALGLVNAGGMSYLLSPFIVLVGAVFVVWILRNAPADPGPSPYELPMVLFTDLENRHLMGFQQPEQFFANCTCPGCGNFDYHPFTLVRYKPSWASVVRQCGVCGRQWGQI